MLLWARLLAERDAIPNPMMEGVGTVTNVATEILAQTEARLLAPPRPPLFRTSPVGRGDGGRPKEQGGE